MLCLVVYWVLRAAFFFFFIFPPPFSYPSRAGSQKPVAVLNIIRVFQLVVLVLSLVLGPFKKLLFLLTWFLLHLPVCRIKLQKKPRQWWAFFFFFFSCILAVVILFCFLWARGSSCASFGFPLSVVKRVPLKADISLLLDLILLTHIVKFVHRLDIFNLYKSIV